MTVLIATRLRPDELGELARLLDAASLPSADLAEPACSSGSASTPSSAMAAWKVRAPTACFAPSWSSPIAGVWA